MSPTLVACLTAVALNLLGTSLLYAVLSGALARLAATGRGTINVIVLVLVTQVFWIAPALLVLVPRDPDGAASYALWFGNWIVTGFALAFLFDRAGRIPRGLRDEARSDGLGLFATWRHTVLPFVFRELALLCVLTVMATAVPAWLFAIAPDAANSIVLFQRFLSPQGRVAMMAACSVVGVLPLLVIFFVAKRGETTDES